MIAGIYLLDYAWKSIRVEGDKHSVRAGFAGELRFFPVLH
jgi:hypothetical protein